MKEAILNQARLLGFDDCKVTSALPPETAPLFEQWLTENRHGEMGYLQRNAHKRVDPQKVLNGARSILTLAVSYSSDRDLSSTGKQPSPSKHEAKVATEADKNSGVGFIARYARFRDYHEII